MRKFLAGRDDGANFGEIWQAVKKDGGTKYAIRSMLQKDRAKGVIKFADGRYSLAPVKK